MARVVRTPGTTTLARIKLGAKELSNVRLKAGWFPSARYENGTPVAYVAAIMELGYLPHNLRPRPFMRPTVKRMTEEWRRIAQEGAASIFNGSTTSAMQIMTKIGLSAQAEIKKSIDLVTSPALSEAYVAVRMRHPGWKHTDKPLERTMLMYNTVTFEVEAKS